MVNEAQLVEKDGGLMPGGEGWFVLNLRDQAPWYRNEAFGAAVDAESEASKWSELGVHLHVLEPGKPNCKYHGESGQEAFLVLSGECLLLVEGQERPLRAWDYFHCPSLTEHVLVGAGDGPCVVLMMGARPPEEKLRYPVAEIARKHGASVDSETDTGREAYADSPRWGPGPRPAGLPLGLDG